MNYEITMIGDFQCPYCYMGKLLVDGLKKEYAIKTKFMGFEIHPKIPARGLDADEYFNDIEGLEKQAKNFADKYNVVLNQNSKISNTNKALQIAEYAKEVGKSDEYNTAMYNAVYVDAINISKVDEIKKIAANVGISPKEVDEVLFGDKYRHILEDNNRFCARHNFTSVPVFIINEKIAIVGLQPIEAFKDAFKKLENAKDAENAENTEDVKDV
jgi:predicted DsbA family dithiol-disulfide isomerase